MQYEFCEYEDALRLVADKLGVSPERLQAAIEELSPGEAIAFQVGITEHLPVRQFDEDGELLPELTPEQEAEALADAEVLARRLATDEPIAPHTPGQQMHYLVETAPWGPRPETPTHRIGGVTVSIG